MKFEKQDEHYKNMRKNFSLEMGRREIWSTIDHWPLYVGMSNLARYMAIADILRSTLDVPGHLAEFGSWKGANLLFLAKLMRIYDPMSSKEIHCFEGFEGLATFTPEDGGANKSHGEYCGNYEELVKMLNLYDLNDDVTIHKGLIQETLPAFLSENKQCMFSFIYCDTDLFEPTDIILNTLHENLSVGGVFVFDQWNFEQWQGETKAVSNFLKKHGQCYKMEHIPRTRQPSLVLKKMVF